MAYDPYVPVEKNIDETQKILEDKLGIGKSFDVGQREIVVMERRIQLYYVTGLVDSELVVDLMTQLLLLNSLPHPNDDIFQTIHNRLVHQQVTVTDKVNDICTSVLSGLVAIIVDKETQAFVVDVRSYPGRGPAEPDTEKTVRGSRDGYTENIVVNTALTRRRIRTGKLRNVILKVGDQSKTDVVLMYIEGIADQGMVDEVKHRIEQVKVDGLTMTDKELEEFITGQVYNPYPLVRYTERPDVVAAHLYQGMIAIIVDTSPSVMIGPVTLFDHLTSVEEYRQTPAVGTFLRLIRYAGIIVSVFLMPTWLLFVLHPEYLPDFLNFIGPQEEGNIPIVLQVISGEIGMEFLRLASIHTPTAISSALGIVSAILIGQVAVDVGLFGPEILFYVAIGALGAFVTPSYELGLANKMFKLFIIVGTALLGLWGYIGTIVIGFIFLATMKSFGKPYLYPLIPFNFKALLKSVIRYPIPYRYNTHKRQEQQKSQPE
ncbi:spore germination protein [Turicibacter bilis]|uniref:Spore germination protein n=1 Tax=Turicibacter bilis TaxID=2735723 RepID=A0ABY5JKT0_9FIRM|nr:spore germination protein [Turicibacter bilis]CUN44207.1 Bacillus/Clostridium GerA spore germination protein [Turicibacter sanguinis]MBS3201144.1 spore germination protein [Turicibacter bilis]MBS3202295.1 spore germination protein [Turicibacter bilis]UUF06834.1 spore germination protein [Turicibacter bilis]UUF10852.1 spore germination protein [Turicibacter bilis]